MCYTVIGCTVLYCTVMNIGETFNLCIQQPSVDPSSIHTFILHIFSFFFSIISFRAFLEFRSKFRKCLPPSLIYGNSTRVCQSTQPFRMGTFEILLRPYNSTHTRYIYSKLQVEFILRNILFFIEESSSCKFWHFYKKLHPYLQQFFNFYLYRSPFIYIPYLYFYIEFYDQRSSYMFRKVYEP